MKKIIQKSIGFLVVMMAIVFLVRGVAQAHLYGATEGDYVIDAGQPSFLIAIDENTGIITKYIGAISMTTDDEEVVGFYNVEGIDFNPLTNLLYAVGQRLDEDPDDDLWYIFTIDPCTGEVDEDSVKEIDTNNLIPNDTTAYAYFFVDFTDISIRSDGNVYAFYTYEKDDLDTGPTSLIGATATIDPSNGDTDELGITASVPDIDPGDDFLNGNGLAFAKNDEEILYHAMSKQDDDVFTSQLNQLDQEDGDIDEHENFDFKSPIFLVDEPAIYAMDAEPVSQTLYGILRTAQWSFETYLVTINKENAEVKVVGAIISEVSVDEEDVSALAFAPLPVANAGQDIVVEQSSWEGAVVRLPQFDPNDIPSYDPTGCCGDALIFTWRWEDPNASDPNQPILLSGKTPAEVFPLGEHEVTLVVDNCNGTAADTVTVSVVDTTAPIITCLPDIIVEQTDRDGTAVVLTTPQVYDVCDADPNIWNDHPSSLFPLGRTEVTWTAKDKSGNTTTCTQAVIVEDTTAPYIISVSASPSHLRRSCLQSYDEVTITVDPNDICDVAPTSKIISVTSNEESLLPWITSPDWVITGNLTLLLKATTNSIFGTRIYTITVQCTDASGNSSTKTVNVDVSLFGGDSSFFEKGDSRLRSRATGRSALEGLRLR